MLKHLKRVYVAFKPGDATAITARELLQRVSSDKARKSNPACKVEYKVDEDVEPGQAYVELHFNDEEKRQLLTQGRGVQDIQRIIEQKGAEMELRGVFKEVKFDPWAEANRLQAGPARR